MSLGKGGLDHPGGQGSCGEEGGRDEAGGGDEEGEEGAVDGILGRARVGKERQLPHNVLKIVPSPRFRILFFYIHLTDFPL